MWRENNMRREALSRRGEHTREVSAERDPVYRECHHARALFWFAVITRRARGLNFKFEARGESSYVAVEVEGGHWSTETEHWVTREWPSAERD